VSASRSPAILASLLDADLARLDPDIDYWRGKARGRTLDLGCGTGRIAAYLRKCGLAAAGLDPSPARLAQARRLAPEVPFVRSTLERWAMRGLGSVICANSAFQELLTREARGRCLACAREALSKDGLITLDLAAPSPNAPATAPRRLAAEFPWDGKRVSKFETAARTAGVLTLREEYFAGGKPLAETTRRLAILNRVGIQEELEAAGFAAFAFFRDWRERPYDERGPRLVVEAART
jgi:trans-aconitate methyltransferase